MVSDNENLVPLNLAIALNVSARGNLKTEGLKLCKLNSNPRSWEGSIS